MNSREPRDVRLPSRCNDMRVNRQRQGKCSRVEANRKNYRRRAESDICSLIAVQSVIFSHRHHRRQVCESRKMFNRGHCIADEHVERQSGSVARYLLRCHGCHALHHRCSHLVLDGYRLHVGHADQGSKRNDRRLRPTTCQVSHRHTARSNAQKTDPRYSSLTQAYSIEHRFSQRNWPILRSAINCGLSISARLKGLE